MHWSRNETSQTFRLAKTISEFSGSVVGLTATPIMLGNRNLYNLLNILNPYEFQSESDFNQRIEVNKHITEAIRSLTHSNYESALQSLEKLETGIYRDQFQTSPLYESIKLRLNDKDRSRANTIKLLKDITELSLLSHIVTRTRRKEIELKAKRNPLTVRLKFTPIEKKFYDAVTEFLKDK
jgi:superfamily II DNA or RNA helicase